MNIFVYSDESGVFDNVHNNIFVFGGVVFLSKDDRDICSRKYSNAEKTIRMARSFAPDLEVKATTIQNSDKNKLYRSLNAVHKFGVVVHQERVLQRIYESKKDKQRYLDYAYKMGVKRHFQHLIQMGLIIPEEVEYLNFFVDEHTTATNGRYELREGLEQEFKMGTYNQTYVKFYPPIFPNLKDVQLYFCNSSTKILVRAADIVANKVYHLAKETPSLPNCMENHLFVSHLP